MTEYARYCAIAVSVVVLVWVAATSCTDRWSASPVPLDASVEPPDSAAPIRAAPVIPSSRAEPSASAPPSNDYDVVAEMAATRRKHEHADYYDLQGTAGKNTPPKHPRPWNAPVETPLARAIRETGSIKNAVGKRSLLSEHYAKLECRWVFTGYNESPLEKAWAAAQESFLHKEVSVGYPKFKNEFSRLIKDMDTHGAAWYTRHQLPTSTAVNTFAGTTTSISDDTAAAFRRETAPDLFSRRLPPVPKMRGRRARPPSLPTPGDAQGQSTPLAPLPTPAPTPPVDMVHPLCQDRPLSGPDPELYPNMTYRLECPAGFAFEKVHPDVARRYKPGAEVAVPIEPMVGVLRSPRVMTSIRELHRHIPSRDYMMVDSWTLRRNLPLTVRASQPRIIFMDMGARGWATSIVRGGAGHNQAWFEWTYRERCVNFDTHIGIEMQKYDQHTFWSDKKQGVPGWMQSRYQWVNRGAEVDPASWGNPWNYVLAETTPDDVVLIKLDIDTPSVEGPLMAQLLQAPEVMKRIDEMYFEYHVNVERMKGPWGTSREKATNVDSINLFKKLRENGVRSHSWI